MAEKKGWRGRVWGIFGGFGWGRWGSLGARKGVVKREGLDLRGWREFGEDFGGLA